MYQMDSAVIWSSDQTCISSWWQLYAEEVDGEDGAAYLGNIGNATISVGADEPNEDAGADGAVVAGGDEMDAVRPGGYRSPQNPAHFEPSPVDLNGTL